tara:strand:- start:667 stop:822 length:156 start_codon:yes stop_codon:yes gene_type:complete
LPKYAPPKQFGGVFLCRVRKIAKIRRFPVAHLLHLLKIDTAFSQHFAQGEF